MEDVAANVYKHHFLEILTFVNNKLGLEFLLQDGNKFKQTADSSIRLRIFLYFNHPRNT